MAQQLNTAITQLQNLLLHLMHLLVALEKTKQRKQVRFEKCHQLLVQSNEQQGGEKAEDGASTQQSS
jgi:hypothetical protein